MEHKISERANNEKGSIAINYMFLLVLGILVLLVLVGFTFFLGDKSRDIIGAIKLPILGG